jgi:hypothetical protein
MAAKEFRISHARVELDGWTGSNEDFYENALSESWGTWRGGHTFHANLEAFGATCPGTRASGLGHIGFVREGDLTTLEWDDSTKEFIRDEASSGVVVPFVIHPEHHLVSFQLMPGAVRQTTFTSNVQALLNLQGAFRWIVTPIALRRTYREWRDTVSRVSAVNLLLTYPNPNWTGREKLEDLVEGLEAEVVRIKARAKDDDGGINTDSDWFAEAMDHIRRGYGRADLEGPDNTTGSLSRFTETIDGGSVPVIDRVEADEHALEATPSELGAARDQLIESHPTDIVLHREVDEGSSDDGTEE